MFNKAIKTGVEKGDFTQPKGKCRALAFALLLLVLHCLVLSCIFLFLGITDASSGPSGPVKLAKKEAAPKPAAAKVFILCPHLIAFLTCVENRCRQAWPQEGHREEDREG